MSLKKAAQLLKEAQHGVVLTGAGISTPSGIPDFRSTGSGLWNKIDPMEVASLTKFRTNPQQFFEWIRPLTETIIQAEPNPAHHTLFELQQLGHISCIITQNIDGLHQKAGSSPVYEVHGGLETMTCVNCFTPYPSKQFLIPFIQDGTLPYCQKCNEILKPDVILFEEQMPVLTWQSAQQAVENCDLLMVIGSSLEVMPVAGLPSHASKNGAKIIIINHDPTYIDSSAAVVIHDDAAEVLPQILNELPR